METVPALVHYFFRSHNGSLSIPPPFEIQEDQVGGIQGVSILPERPPFLTKAPQNNRLLPEILIAIFDHVLKQKLDPPKDHPSRFAPDLVSVTHVCSFWRRVAINAPHLWNRITVANSEAAEVFLKRSGNLVPLNVDLRPMHLDILEAVLLHAHRFRRFSLSPSQYSIYDPFKSLTKPAPLLESLDINFPTDFRPHILFDGQLSRLRELVLLASNLWL